MNSIRLEILNLSLNFQQFAYLRINRTRTWNNIKVRKFGNLQMEFLQLDRILVRN